MSVLIEKKNSNFHLIVYQISATLQYYKDGIDFTAFDLAEFNEIQNEQKQLQWLASRYWVKKLSKRQHQLHLHKSELGKPHITNFPLKFSISHTRDIIAVICSETHDVAIDIESIQDKIIKIKSKFLHPEDFEQENNAERLTMIWSAKETIYKLYHTKDLYSFKEQIAIKCFLDDKMIYTLSNCNIQKNKEVYYEKIDETILTWIVLD